jgi:hypothetical protein
MHCFLVFAVAVVILGEYHGVKASCTYTIEDPESKFCISMPTSQYRNGVAPILSACDELDALQRFRLDPVYHYIQPADSEDWCLDFEFDDKKYRPLTLFRCGGEVAGSGAKPGHQKWNWPLGDTPLLRGQIKNAGTGMCIGTGKDVYAGKYLQQFPCDGVSEFQLAEMPDRMVGDRPMTRAEHTAIKDGKITREERDKITESLSRKSY